MAEHSICHPGRPAPQGEPHDGSLVDLLNFHRAKSFEDRLSFWLVSVTSRPAANHSCCSDSVISSVLFFFPPNDYKFPNVKLLVDSRRDSMGCSVGGSGGGAVFRHSMVNSFGGFFGEF